MKVLESGKMLFLSLVPPKYAIFRGVPPKSVKRGLCFRRAIWITAFTRPIVAFMTINVPVFVVYIKSV